MTSDAKIGLLIGLLFIFIIALIINGLPNLRGSDDNNELTTNMVRSHSNTPGIGGAGREVIRQTNGLGGQFQDGDGAEAVDDEDVLYTRVLQIDPTIVAASDNDMGVSTPGGDVKVEPSVPALPKVYVIEAYDNLSLIAKKFYGQEEGNKLANIMRIFEANRNVLRSVDEIREGQKITIPPLPGSGQSGGTTDGIFSGSLFDRDKSIGQRYFSADASKPAAAAHKVYVVKENDSLWRIATAHLGSGVRYKEIVRLNAGVLGNEDSIAVGMRLKIPAR
jgi:nucleoid-associated protein YgaU